MNEKKITVLIADDEELICVLLQKIILWEKLKLEFLGAVHNGELLYETILEKKPDIVITDICMPKMNGIELIGRVREENFPCRFIIVSGYRQFEYAHNALKYGVEDYILKPVENDELNATLKKLTQEILAERQNDAGEALEIKKGAERMKRFFFNRIIRELDSESSDLSVIEREFGISFTDGFFQSVHVKSDVIENIDDFSEYADSVQNKIEQIFREAFEECCHTILFDVEADEVKIGINYIEENSTSIKEKMSEFMIKIQNLVDLFKDYKVTIGVGRAYREIWNWKLADKEAEYAVESRLVQGLGKIIYWEREQKEEAAEIFSKEDEKQFLNAVVRAYESLDVEGFEKLMSTFFIRLRTKFSSSEMMRLLYEIINSWFECEEDFYVQFENKKFWEKQLMYGMRRATTIKEMEQAVSTPICQVMRQVIENVKIQNTKPIRLSIKYIEENYEQAMKLEDVALHIGLNPAYFSNVFKKETGENFTEYLLNYRMERAKEFLRANEMNINEIAARCGYTDTGYFSKLFKKTVGIKPTEYRKIYG